MASTYDVLILGRGIAGAVLAEACRMRGLSFHVFDWKREGNASMAAGGVVNPVVLRRDVPCWRASELMLLSPAFYEAWQERLSIIAWHPMSVVKIFPTPNEVKQWARAMAKPGTAPFIASRPEPEIDAAPLHVPHGYGTVTAAAWLDIPMLLDAQRAELMRNGEITERDVNRAGRMAGLPFVLLSDVDHQSVISQVGDRHGGNAECRVSITAHGLHLCMRG